MRKHPERLAEPPQREGSTFRADCPCPKKKCELHGFCEPCRQKHARRHQLPRCER